MFMLVGCLFVTSNTKFDGSPWATELLQFLDFWYDGFEIWPLTLTLANQKFIVLVNERKSRQTSENVQYRELVGGNYDE